MFCRTSGGPAIYLFAVSSTEVSPSAASLEWNVTHTRARAMMISLVFAVSACTMCMPRVMILCVWPYREISTRFHLVSGRSSLIDLSMGQLLRILSVGCGELLTFSSRTVSQISPLHGNYAGHAGGKTRMRGMWGFSPRA